MGSASSKSKPDKEETGKKQKASSQRSKGYGNDNVVVGVHHNPPKGTRRAPAPYKGSVKPQGGQEFVPYEPENLTLEGDWETEKGVDNVTPVSELGYPAPRPSKIITDKSAFTAIDFDVLQNNDPKLCSGTFEEVATVLTCNHDLELHKVRALTTWIGCQKIRSRQYPKDIQEDAVIAYMKLMKDNQGTFAGLLAKLCRSIQIPCMIIRGVYKSMCHQVGESSVPGSRCTWNAVHVDGNWQLVHPYLICTPLSNTSPVDSWKLIETSKQEPPARNAAVFNSFFFASNPADFTKLCLPDSMHIQWQLMDNKVTSAKFLQFPFLRPAFHDSGLKLKTKHQSVDKTEAGVFDMRIQCQPSNVNDIHLMYELYSESEEFDVDPEWGKLVLCGRVEDYWVVQVKFPATGTFKLALYAHLYDWFFWVGDFKIVCDEPFNNFVPQPTVPEEIGYGPSALSEEAGLLSPSHEGGIVFYKPGEEHIIKFLVEEKPYLSHEIENSEREREDLHKYCRIISRRYEVDFLVMLPFRGEFALRIYKTTDNNDRVNVCNYLFVEADDSRSRENPFQRRARASLREATAGHEISDLEAAIAKFKVTKLEPDDDYTRANRRLNYLKLRKGLRDARLRNHEFTLQKAITDAENSSFKQCLGRSIEQARAMLGQLQSLEVNTHPVQEMDHKCIAEIANFNNPPRDVHNTMMATYLLLGESKYDLKKWGHIQALLRKQGKGNIQHKIQVFQESPVPDRATIQHVQKLHDSVPKQYIVAASLSAAAFYDWVTSALAYLQNKSQNALEYEDSFETQNTNDRSTFHGYHGNKLSPEDGGEISQDEGFLDSQEAETNSGDTETTSGGRDSQSVQ